MMFFDVFTHQSDTARASREYDSCGRGVCTLGNGAMQVFTDEEDESTLLEQLRLAMVRKSTILYAPVSRMENSHLPRPAQDKKITTWILSAGKRGGGSRGG